MATEVELEELKGQLRDLMRQYGTNLAGQQTPDGSYGFYTPDFSYGSYKMPYEDPTYRSGFEYARTIAGGMPFEDVVAPGMSFSPEEPMGYTQADLRKKEIYGDFNGVMPVAPTKGTPFAPNEGFVQMPSAPQGVSEPTRIHPDKTEITEIPDYFKGLDFSSLQDLDFSSLPDTKPAEPKETKPAEPKEDFFKVDQNLLNLKEIADKIDLEEVAKIDIEKIDIPESVSLFSDILNEPVSAEPVIPKPVLPSIFEPAAPVMPTKPIQTLPQNIFANIPKPQPMPVIPNIPKLPIVPQPVMPQPVMPTSIPRVSTPLIPSFVQPNIEEIVRPIAVGKQGLPQYGLFNLV
jgi:hypothetical protein